jgi:hypothetical protein
VLLRVGSRTKPFFTPSKITLAIARGTEQNLINLERAVMDCQVRIGLLRDLCDVLEEYNKELRVLSEITKPRDVGEFVMQADECRAWQQLASEVRLRIYEHRIWHRC